MTTDNNADAQIPAEHMISDQQEINDFDSLLEYLAKINSIDVEGILKCYLNYGPITRLHLSGRMFFKSYKKEGLVFAPNWDALKHYDANWYDLSDTAKEAGCVRFLWPTKDKIVYRKDGFTTRGLEFRYVEQRDLRFPLPLSEAEQAALAKRKAEEDELHFQWCFKGSEEKRRAAYLNLINGLAATNSIYHINELIAYCRAVHSVYASGVYQGRQYDKEWVRIEITNKYIWLDDQHGNMVQILRPNRTDIKYEADGFSTGGFTFKYTTEPYDIPTVAAMIRSRNSGR